MGLSNASARARNYTRTANQNQGGGSKKAGFPSQIGRESWTSIFIHSTAPVYGRCCTLPQQMTMKFPSSKYQARPVGGSITVAQKTYSPV
jgi:hypothetical protein